MPKAPKNSSTGSTICDEPQSSSIFTLEGQDQQFCYEAGKEYRPFKDPQRIIKNDRKKASHTDPRVQLKDVPEGYMSIMSFDDVQVPDTPTKKVSRAPKKSKKGSMKREVSAEDSVLPKTEEIIAYSPDDTSDFKRHLYPSLTDTHIQIFPHAIDSDLSFLDQYTSSALYFPASDESSYSPNFYPCSSESELIRPMHNLVMDDAFQICQESRYHLEMPTQSLSPSPLGSPTSSTSTDSLGSLNGEGVLLSGGLDFITPHVFQEQYCLEETEKIFQQRLVEENVMQDSYGMFVPNDYSLIYASDSLDNVETHSNKYLRDGVDGNVMITVSTD